MIFPNPFVILSILMEVKYLGHSSFFIKTKEGRLVTDPFNPSIGLRFPKVEADIVTVSHAHFDHNATSLVGGTPVVIDMPGEFEKSGLRITGYPSFHDKKKGSERGENILYKIEADGISLLHCGDLGCILEDSLIDEIGKVDILFIPVGGTFTINSSEALEVIKKLEPSIVIPMHFRSKRMTAGKGQDLAPVDEFLKKMGAEAITPLPKLVIKKDELGGEMKVTLLGE